MQVRMQDGKIKDVSILEATPENFIVPTGEEQYYHCRIEVRKFNQDTGKRLSIPRIQCFGIKFFENGGREELARQGYTVEVLHDPAKWIEQKRKEAQELTEAQKLAEAEKIAEAEKLAKKKKDFELLEKLKAAGTIEGTASEFEELKKAGVIEYYPEVEPEKEPEQTKSKGKK